MAENTVSKLKPCPFCGSTARLYGGVEWGCVECDNMQCYASVPGDTPHEAMMGWNRRAEENSGNGSPTSNKRKEKSK